MKETYSALMSTYTKDKTKFQMIFDVRNKRMSVEEFKKNVLEFCERYYPQEENKEGVVQDLIDSLFGYGVLTALIENPDISDIKVHAWNNIIIKEKGKRKQSDVHFHDETQYNRFIESVITRNQVNASSRNAIQRFTDDDSFPDFILRFTLATGFVTTEKNYELIIRKVLRNFPSMDELVRAEMMTNEMKDYLIRSWKRGSILVCGANSSGKTTILNALKEEIPRDKSVLVIQQAEELTTKHHPDMIFLHSIEGSSESDIKYTLKELSIAGLTMDIDYFIIGEIKGDEALYLLNASYTGHTCGGTIHASSSESALDKLVDYALYSSSYSKEELLHMLTEFKTVIFMKNYKVKEISEIEAVEGDHVTYKTIFRSYRPSEDKM